MRSIRIDRRAERVAIGERNVAPHFRRARCDPREIAKSACGKTENVVGIAARGEKVDEREREHVREVRDGGKDAVVHIGVELAYPTRKIHVVPVDQVPKRRALEPRTPEQQAEAEVIGKAEALLVTGAERAGRPAAESSD